MFITDAPVAQSLKFEVSRLALIVETLIAPSISRSKSKNHDLPSPWTPCSTTAQRILTPGFCTLNASHDSNNSRSLASGNIRAMWASTVSMAARSLSV